MEQAPPAHWKRRAVEAVAGGGPPAGLRCDARKAAGLRAAGGLRYEDCQVSDPDNIQVTKEAKQAFAKAAGIFIVYLTTCANDICKDKKKQTVTAQDIRRLWGTRARRRQAPARGVPRGFAGRTR